MGAEGPMHGTHDAAGLLPCQVLSTLPSGKPVEQGRRADEVSPPRLNMTSLSLLTGDG